jgi:hypothetical protein
MDGMLQDKEALQNLLERLSACRAVTQYGPDEAGTLVHAFSDLEESFRRFLDEQLPKLADPAVKGRELEEVLQDISLEFRHILYHIHDPMFFRIIEPTHGWLVLSKTSGA